MFLLDAYLCTSPGKENRYGTGNPGSAGAACRIGGTAPCHGAELWLPAEYDGRRKAQMAAAVHGLRPDRGAGAGGSDPAEYLCSAGACGGPGIRPSGTAQAL